MTSTTNTPATPKAKSHRRSAIASTPSAMDVVRRRQSDHAAAVTAERELRERLSAGDDTVTTSELSASRTEIDRAARLLAAAERGALLACALADVPRNSGVSDLVDAVAPALSAALGRPVRPHDGDNVPGDGTAVAWAFGGQKSDLYQGTLSGTVRVAWHAGEGESFDGDRISERLRSDSQMTARVSRRSDRGRPVTLLSAEVVSAFPPVLTVPTAVPQWAVAGVGRLVAGVVASTDLHSETECSIRSTNTTTDGLRRIVAEVDIVVSPHPGNLRWDGETIGRRIESARSAIVGRAVGSVGRVESVDVARVRPANSSGPARRAVLTLVLTGRVAA